MRIAHILPALANQGPEIVARDIVNSLVGRVAAIDVYYFDDIVELDFATHTRRIGLWGRTNLEEYDIIHSHGIRPAAYVWRNRKRLRAKCCTTLHCYIGEDLAYEYGRCTSYVARHIWYYLLTRQDMLIGLSGHMAQYYRKLLGRSDITYVYNGINEVRDREPVGEHDHALLSSFKDGGMMIGAVCRVLSRKGLEHILEYLVLDGSCKCVVIGDGPDVSRLIAIAKRLNVSERVLFLGYRRNAIEYFKYFDIYVLASRSEGFPLALIEAASCKRAIVCSDIPICRECFTDREVAFFHIDDIASFASAVSRARENLELLGANAYAKYRECYTVKAMADKYEAIYAELMAR